MLAFFYRYKLIELNALEFNYFFLKKIRMGTPSKLKCSRKRFSKKRL